MTIGSPKLRSFDLAVSQVDQLKGQCSPFYFQGQRLFNTLYLLFKRHNPTVSEACQRKFALNT